MLRMMLNFIVLEFYIFAKIGRKKVLRRAEASLVSPRCPFSFGSVVNWDMKWKYFSVSWQIILPKDCAR